MGFKGICQTGQGHFFPFLNSIEKRFELTLVRVVRDIARVKHLHGKFTPFILVKTSKFCRIKLIIQKAPFTPNKMKVKVVWLQTINY